MNVGISCLIDFMDVLCVLVNTLFSGFYEQERHEKVQVGKDQEKAQSEKDSHSKNRGGKKPN